MRINDILHTKGAGVITVTPQASIRELVSLLAEHNVGALVVSHDGKAVEGIVSERDIVRSLQSDPGVLDATVDSIMTSDVASCDPQKGCPRADAADDGSPDPACSGRHRRRAAGDREYR